MTGMDMSNTPTAAILHAFYGGMLIAAGMWMVAVLVFWQLRRRKAQILRAHVETESARVLRIGLAALWIFDGLLQAQPDMSSEFVPYVLVPVMSGQPTWLAHWMITGAVWWGRQPVLSDIAVLLLQLTIGLLLLSRDAVSVRVGAYLSLIWGLAVWVMGEGLGGLLAGSPSWLTGAPGSALLYSFCSGLLLARPDVWSGGAIRRLVKVCLGILWIVMGWLQLTVGSAHWTAANVIQWMISMADMQQPAFLSRLLTSFSRLLAAHPAMFTVLFGTVLFVLGIGSLVQYGSRWLLVSTLVWLLFTWVIALDFGIFGGLGTDPGTPPVVALLLWATWRRPGVRKEDALDGA